MTQRSAAQRIELKTSGGSSIIKFPRPDTYDQTRAVGTSVRKQGSIHLGWSGLDRATSFDSTPLATVDTILTAYTSYAGVSINFIDFEGTSISVYWLEPPKINPVKGTGWAIADVDITLVEY